MSLRSLVFVTCAVAFAARQDEALPPGPKVYFGREIATTMHWMGAEWLMRETRSDEEDTATLLANVGVEPGDVVCDLGSGNGYYTIPIARAVGAEGKVLAVDIQPEMLSMLEERAAAAELSNIETVKAVATDPGLAPKSCDLVLIVDVYHEISHPVEVMRHVRAALKPEGVVVLAEFRSEDPEVPIKRLHKMSKAQILAEMASHGLRFVREFDGLPRQHLMSFGLDPEFPREGGEDLAIGDAVAKGLFRAIGAGDALSLSGFAADEVLVHKAVEVVSMTRDAWVEEFERDVEDISKDALRLMFAALEKERRIGAADGDWRRGQAGDRQLFVRDVGWLLRRTDVGTWQVIEERGDG